MTRTLRRVALASVGSAMVCLATVAGRAEAQTDGTGSNQPSTQAPDAADVPSSGSTRGPAIPSSRRGDPTPPRQTRPAPSVKPSERILADSVVSFPVDI